ncbi:MAG TPA: hypothetical protein VGH80_07865 [Xanthomonadaceae bacterium]|jgi:hypothetical protein
MNAIARPLHADIGIGGIQVRLRTDSRDFIDLLGERYAGFLGKAANVDYEFDMHLQPPEGTDPDDEVSVFRRDDLWCLQRGDFRAEWDPSARRGWIRQDPNPYSVDSVLRIVHSLLLAREGGMLMHASSVVRDGRAYVFAGVSGVGKTTISRLAPAGVHVLTDEMSYIRREREGYFAYGTPFSGELGRPGENLRAPLAAIHLLAQGPENRIDELAPAEAVRGLLANILFFAQDRELVQAVFAAAIELAGRVPVRRLTFAPDARVWDLIGQENVDPKNVGQENA